VHSNETINSLAQLDLSRNLPPLIDIQHPCIRGYVSDCLVGMRQILPTARVSIVITSPPYNIGANYNGYKDSLPREEYLAWMGEVAAEVRRVLKDDGSFFLNVGNKPTDQWIAWDVARRVGEHFVLQNTLHWVKSIAIPKKDVGHYPVIWDDIAVGHYKPINSRRFVHDCQEYIFHFTKTGNVPLDRLAVGVPYQDKSNIGRWKWAGKDLRCRGNTWFIPYKTIKSRDKERPHPATFPPQLAEMCIRLHGLERARLVLDPFMGLGSTALACKALGVDFVGFEVDESYVNVASRLLNG